MAWGSDGDDAAGYSPDEARVLAAVAALCGGPCFLADDLAQLSEDEIAILADANFLKRCWGDGLRPSDIFSLSIHFKSGLTLTISSFSIF